MSIDLREAAKREEEIQSIAAPERGVVRSVLPGKETLKIEVASSAGTSTIAIRHPYVGVNSWIRCMPETGTTVVTQKLRDPAQREIWGYVSHVLGNLARRAKDDNNAVVYRELRPGEIEIMSSGRAYTHWSEEGNIEFHGGVVELSLMQTELEAVQRAPTHKRQLDQHVPNTLDREERFGLVKRPDLQKPYALQRYIKQNDAYQYEYLRLLTDDQARVMVHTREGHVYDDGGNEIKSGKTNRRIRYQKVIGEATNRGELTLDVDEELNTVLVNSNPNKVLVDLDFGTQGEVKIASKKLDFTISQTSNQNFTQALTITTPKVRVSSADVGFGAAPVIPAVLGTPLATNVLVPVITMVQAITTAMVAVLANPAVAPATITTLTGLSASLGALVPTINSTILSTEVKFTK